MEGDGELSCVRSENVWCAGECVRDRSLKVDQRVWERYIEGVERVTVTVGVRHLMTRRATCCSACVFSSLSTFNVYAVFTKTG